MEKIEMIHGSGGQATSDLINEVFAKEFWNGYLAQMNDSSVVAGGAELALTTDSFVVKPLFFKGGDIGRMSVAGTVNDLLMRGAVPEYMTVGFIMEEGLPISDLKKIVHSMATTAEEAGILIVAGDTKVVEGHGGLYINTTGVGFVPVGMEISPAQIEKGDVILVSGNLGDHHAAVLSSRMSIENEIASDCAPLNDIVRSMINEGVPVHAMRDVTRGGLATVCKEVAAQSGKTLMLQEEQLPVSAQVKDFCALTGLDPLYMGNEGKLVLVLPEEAAEKALSIMKASHYGEDACRIGHVLRFEEEKEMQIKPDGGELFLKTAIGGTRRLSVLQGEGLPRIC